MDSDFRYLKFVEKFKKCCSTVQEEYTTLGYDDIKLRIKSYKTSAENWWCCCPAYKDSPYHLCKHLVGLYIGEEGLSSNKPRMPHYGQVWRQPCVPPLWVSGIHDESLLVVRELQISNDSPPILSTNILATVDLLTPASNTFTHSIEGGEYYDSEEEDDDDDDRSDQRSVQDSGYEDEGGLDDGFADAEEDARLELEGEQKIKELREYHGKLLRLAHAVESEVSHPHISLMPDPISENTAAMMEWADRWDAEQQRREERGEKVRAYARRLHHLIQACENALEYPATHPYLRQIPEPTIAHTSALMDWADSWHVLQHGYVMRPTWGLDRARNMFC